MPASNRTPTFLRYGRFVFSVGSARVLGILLTSATFPFVVRHIGVELYGLWNYIVAICGILANVASLGLTNYGAQQIAARRAAAFGVVSDILFLRAMSTALAVGGLLVAMSFETRKDLHHLLFWYGLGYLLVNLSGSDYLLGALEMFHARSIFSVIQQALYALGIFTFVRGPQDLGWVAISVLASAAVSSLAGWIYLWRKGFRLRPTLQPGEWRAILVPSVHYALSSLMASIYSRTNYVVVRWILGDHALGLYAASARLVDFLRQIGSIFLTVLMPRVAATAESEEQVLRLSRFATVVLVAINLPLMVGLFCTAKFVVPWILGKSYLEAVFLIQLMSPYIVIASAASLLNSTILYGMGKHRAYLKASVAGTVASIVLSLCLVPLFHLNGAGIALLGAELAVVVTAYFHLPILVRALWKTPILGTITLSALGMGVVVTLVSQLVQQAWILVSIGVVVYSVAFVGPIRKWLTNELHGAS
jgi:O-antigen/teichoic acid export membrane protein